MDANLPLRIVPAWEKVVRETLDSRGDHISSTDHGAGERSEPLVGFGHSGQSSQVSPKREPNDVLIY